MNRLRAWGALHELAAFATMVVAIWIALPGGAEPRPWAIGGLLVAALALGLSGLRGNARRPRGRGDGAGARRSHAPSR